MSSTPPARSPGIRNDTHDGIDITTDYVAARVPARHTVERMTGAGLKVIREHLGLTTRWLAEQLNVPERTLQRWEMGLAPTIPEHVRIAVAQLEVDTAAEVRASIETALRAQNPLMATYRNDAEFHQHQPTQQRWTAAWHRAVVARVAREVPGLAVDYWITWSSMFHVQAEGCAVIMGPAGRAPACRGHREVVGGAPRYDGPVYTCAEHADLLIDPHPISDPPA